MSKAIRCLLTVILLLMLLPSHAKSESHLSPIKEKSLSAEHSIRGGVESAILPLPLGLSDTQTVSSLNEKPILKLSPQIRVKKSNTPLAVSEESLHSYSASVLLLSAPRVANSARVLGSSTGLRLIHQQHPLYISGNQTHKEWRLYRIVRKFVTDEQMMLGLRSIASATLTASNESFSSLVIHDQRQEILVDDVAIPVIAKEQQNKADSFSLRSAPSGLRTQILGAFDNVHFAAQEQLVVIDSGIDDGVMKGSVFSLFNHKGPLFSKSSNSQYLSLASKNKVILPNQKVGRLMVIQAYKRLSLAVVMNSTSQISKDTLILPPILLDGGTISSPKWLQRLQNPRGGH